MYGWRKKEARKSNRQHEDSAHGQAKDRAKARGIIISYRLLVNSFRNPDVNYCTKWHVHHRIGRQNCQVFEYGAVWASLDMEHGQKKLNLSCKLSHVSRYVRITTYNTNIHTMNGAGTCRLPQSIHVSSLGYTWEQVEEESLSLFRVVHGLMNPVCLPTRPAMWRRSGLQILIQWTPVQLQGSVFACLQGHGIHVSIHTPLFSIKVDGFDIAAPEYFPIEVRKWIYVVSYYG
jgi:hypothetical protein